MQIWQAQFVGSATMLVAVVSLTVSPGMAQQGGQTFGPNPTSSGKGIPMSTPPPASTPNPTPPPPANTQVPRVIWVTGKVTMSDGGQPPESVIIETVCSDNSARSQGYTDPQGDFSVSVGSNSSIISDASTSRFPDQIGATGARSSNSSSNGGVGNPTMDAFVGCDLRARLPGYRSDTISLAGRRVLDNPNVGVIVLYPIAAIQGLTTSATSSQAPKDARKAYEKGLDALNKGKPDQAEQEFRKAVQIYPRYAEGGWSWERLSTGESAIRRRARLTPAHWRPIRSLCIPISSSTGWRCARRTGRASPRIRIS